MDSDPEQGNEHRPWSQDPILSGFQNVIDVYFV